MAMRRVDGNVAVVGYHRRPLYVVMVALGPVDAPGLAEAFEAFPCRTSMRFWPEAPARLPWVGACELAAAEELDPDLAGNIHEAIVEMVRDLQMELERINRGN